MALVLDLIQVQSNLTAAIKNGDELTLMPANAAEEGMITFLRSIPDQQVIINAVALSINLAKDQLIVRGNTNLTWQVRGWGTGSIMIQRVEVQYLNRNNRTESIVLLEGNVLIASQNVPVIGTLQPDNTLLFRATTSANTKISLLRIADFISNNRLANYLPVGIDIFDNIPFTSLELSFGFARSATIRKQFISDVGVNWELVSGLIELKKIGLTLQSLGYYSNTNNFIESFGGNIHATILLGEEFDIRLGLSDRSEWMIEIIPKTGNVLPGLQNLAGLIGGNTAQQTVKNDLEKFGLNAVALDYVGIGVNIGEKKINRIKLNGHITFYDHDFLIETNLPNFEFYGSLSPNTPIHLKALINIFFSGAEAFPEIDISSINISLQPKIDTYSLYISIESDWEYKIGSTSFGIKEFSFQIQKQQKALTGWMEGKFTFLGAEFDLFAQHPEADGGWLIEGHNIPDQPILIGALIKQIGDQFGTGSSLPAALTDLEIKLLQVSFNTTTKDFYFFCDTKFPIDKKDLDAVIKIELTHNNGKYTRKFSGVVTVGDLQFDLIFQQEQDSDTVFLAAFENKAGKDESIQPLVALMTDNAEILKAAEGITFNLKDALLVIDKGQTTKILFGLDIGGGIDLSKMPLVGKMLPENASVRMTFQPLLTNQDFLSTELDKIRTLVPAGGFQLPKEAKERLGFNMQLMISQQLLDFSLPIGVNDVKSQPATAAVPTTNMTSTTSASAAPPASAGNVKWFVIQKQLGPIHFGRVGVQYEQSQLYFLLDASLSLAGLTISLDGLYVSSTLKPIQPKFGLHGLGIDYKKGPLEIGGAFLRQTFTDKSGNTYDTYDGTAIIRTKKFALAALGSYSYYQGHPSLFIYAFVNVPLGGPPFFFVTGLAAGFGYNRRILVPGIDGVASFPLVAEAMSGVPGTTNDLGVEIQKLHDVITPSVGDYFFAVGIRFSSFKIIDSFALLVVSFGSEFELDVLGLSTLVLPTPDVGSSIEPLAEVQLALQAVFNPDKGYLKVQAALTAASFIFSRKCHLTGGFAFYTWFKDDPQQQISAGDFVLTIGGYHPLFKVPAHYPKVAPLGLNWQVTSELLIKGDLYFALVPSAVMAGGHLSATYVSGNLRAWFNLGVDFIISWKPYFYDASLYIGFGASYTFKFFGTHTISVELGADLHIWGPEFSGHASLHIWIFTVGVSFGAGVNQAPPELNWDGFRKGFLPDIQSWESALITQGLTNQLKVGNQTLNVVNPKEVVIETNTALPITHLNGNKLTDCNTTIHIGSMGITADTDVITSNYKINVLFGATDVSKDFSFVPIKKDVPGALWGKKTNTSTPPKGEELLVKNVCMGFTITGKPAKPAPGTHTVDSVKLLTEEISFSKTAQLGSAPPKLNQEWLKNKGVKNKVSDSIESKQDARNTLLKAMGFKDTYYPNKALAEELVLTAA